MGRKRASKKQRRRRGKRKKKDPRSPEAEPTFIAEELGLFTRDIASLRFPRAMARYYQVLDELLQVSLGELLDGKVLPCEPGCDTCCHQPLILSLAELGDIYFQYEDTLSGSAFLARVEEERGALARWQAEGAVTPPELARRQWAERRPCLFLQEGKCSVHPARPDICRNAFAEERCTPESLNTFGFANIPVLASRMQQALWKRYGLARFTPHSEWLLPDGLSWLREQAPLDQMRSLWLGQVDYLPVAREASLEANEGGGILTLPGARHACGCCGEGCRIMEVGPLGEGDIERLQAHDYGRLGLAGGVDIVDQVDTAMGPALFMHKEQGACVLLDLESQRCKVHEVYGLEAKPLPCQAFPRRLVRVPGGVRVSLMPACQERHATFLDGPPLTDQLSELERLAGLGLGRAGPFPQETLGTPRQATVALLPDLHLAWPLYLALEDELLAALEAREVPVEQVLAGALRRLHDHALPGELDDARRQEQARECQERFFTLLQQEARGQDALLARVAGRLSRGERVGPIPWRIGCEGAEVQALAAEFLRNEIWGLETLRASGSLLPGLVLLCMTHVAACWLAAGEAERVEPAGYNQAFARVDGFFRRLALGKAEALLALASEPQILLGFPNA